MNERIYVTTKYKDTIFRMLFKAKHRLLELFNAINSTNYDNPEKHTTPINYQPELGYCACVLMPEQDTFAPLYPTFVYKRQKDV